MNIQRLRDFPWWPQCLALFVLALGFGGYRYFAYYDTRSNDAYVSANIINMAAIVSGPLSRIYVLDNQLVKKGDKLIEVDPRPYLYALQQARADLKIAELNYRNSSLAIEIAEENLKESRDLLALSQDHFKRYQALVGKGAMPEIQLTDVKARIREREANVLAALHRLKIAQQNLDDSHVRSASARLAIAQYNYDHTILTAPADGYVTNFNVRCGQFVKRGEGLFAVVDTSQWWVVTRYRETALRLIKPGDPVRIKLDMYPGKEFHGHVLSIGWGINRVQSGNVATSTLVYLEATEYWIKIAQRFPVRIQIDDVSPDFPLRIGASATTVTYP